MLAFQREREDCFASDFRQEKQVQRTVFQKTACEEVRLASIVVVRRSFLSPSTPCFARAHHEKQLSTVFPLLTRHFDQKDDGKWYVFHRLFYPLRKQWHIIAVRRISSALTSISRQSEYIISRRLYTLSHWCKERSDGIASLRASIQNRVLMIYRNELRMIYNGKPLIF